jgi:Uma2 family endonuclease
LPAWRDRGSVSRVHTEITFRSEQRLTPEEFFAWLQERPYNDVNRYELIHGRIAMTPGADFFHGSTEARLVRYLATHVEARGLGTVLGSSVGYDLPSGDMLEPDVSFVSNERLAAGPAPEHGRHARLVPDLVIEILSRSTAKRDRGVKKEIYAANGVREYWLVDPVRRRVTIFQRGDEGFDDGTVFTSGRVTSLVLAGLDFDVEALW